MWKKHDWLDSNEFTQFIFAEINWTVWSGGWENVFAFCAFSSLSFQPNYGAVKMFRILFVSRLLFMLINWTEFNFHCERKLFVLFPCFPLLVPFVVHFQVLDVKICTLFERLPTRPPHIHICTAKLFWSLEHSSIQAHGHHNVFQE